MVIWVGEGERTCYGAAVSNVVVPISLWRQPDPPQEVGKARV